MCTEFGTFWPKCVPPKMNTKILGFARAAHFYWKWSLHLITTFLFNLHLITTFLFPIALDHHISIYVCTWSPHFYLSLHLITTFLFTLQKVFRSILLSWTWSPNFYFAKSVPFETSRLVSCIWGSFSTFFLPFAWFRVFRQGSKKY